MGKFREKSKLCASRFDPTDGRPAKRMKTEPQGLAVLYGKLKSIEECDYLHGLHTLGALAGDGLEAVTTILEFGDEDGAGALLRLLTPFLRNKKLHVCLAAIGTLRNLSSCGSSSHIEQLLQSDVLPSVCQDLVKYVKSLIMGGQLEPAQAADVYGIVEQIAFICYNLCEVSEDATNVVSNTPDMISSLVKLSLASFEPPCPVSCQLAASLALLCLSEENPQVAGELKSYGGPLMDKVRLAKNSTFSPTVNKNLAFELFNALVLAGIIINIDVCEEKEEFTSVVLNLIHRSVSVSPKKLVEQHISAVAPKSPTNPPPTSPPTLPPPSILSPEDLNKCLIFGESVQNGECGEDSARLMDEAAANDEEIVLQFEQTDPEPDNGCLSTSGWQVIEYWLEAQQLGLELLNNICCDSDEDSAVSCSARVLAPEKDEGDDEEDMDETDPWEPCDDDGTNEVLEQFVKEHRLFDLVFEILEPLNSDQHTSLQGSKYFNRLQILLNGVRMRALSALQVILELLNIETLGPELLFQRWADLGRLAFAEHQQQTVDDNILEGATGAMRAVVSKFGREHASHLSAITASELEMLFSVGLSSAVSGVRRNLARLVGALGCLLLTQGSAEDIMRDPAKTVLMTATTFLLQLAATDPELPVCAEALDVIIDLYSDDRTDHLAVESNLITRLRSIVNFFNARYKKDKRKYGQHRVLLVTVKENLPAFIKYKEPRVLNAKPSKQHASKQRPDGPKHRKIKRK